MLRWLRSVLGTSSNTGANGAAADAGAFAIVNLGHGGFDFEVVGEQSYQNRLRRVSGGRVERGERVIIGCQLRYEINPHTHGPAVRVDTSDGHTVGHFPAEQAELYASAFDELERGGSIAECQGVLVGAKPGKPSFGIYLDFEPSLLTGRRAD